MAEHSDTVGQHADIKQKSRYLKNFWKVFYSLDICFLSLKLFKFSKNINQNPNYGLSKFGADQNLLLAAKFFQNGSEIMENFIPQKS